MNSFEQKVIEASGQRLKKSKVEILQVNVGKLCNLACVHCHVEAGPTRTAENMNRETAEAVVRVMDLGGIQTLDLTGGAPELNPHFKFLVLEARKRGVHVIDRCNLTVFFEPGMSDIPSFLVENQVEVIASLPCYSKKNVDKQRGKGTFSGSIDALLLLNRLGYGKSGTGLMLNLVYNPVGPHLPPPQDTLEKEYKARLREDFDIVFNRLYTITNMAITRYKKYLKAFGQLESYEELLLKNFNPHTLDDLMCRNTLSVSWDGNLYDCDFNQVLGMPVRNTRPLTILDVTLDDLAGNDIQVEDHCFGCTGL